MSNNNFEEDLAWSESHHSADWWTPYYQKVFPENRAIERVPGPTAAQRAGIDKIVILKSGKRIYVDEKLRRNRPPTDILLEFRHVPTNGDSIWTGWIEAPNAYTDWLAMGFEQYKTAFFFPFVLLQNAWKENKAEWIRRFSVVRAANPFSEPRYHTHCCPVPCQTLLETISNSMRVEL